MKGWKTRRSKGKDVLVEGSDMIGRILMKAESKGAGQVETWENNVFNTTQETHMIKTATWQVKVTVRTKYGEEGT